MTAGPAERQGEGAIEEDDPDEGKPAEDQEGGRLVRSDDGEDHAGHDADRSISNDPSEMARREREVQMAEPGRQQYPLRVIPVVVGDARVEVVDDPDLEWGADQVEDQADREGLGEPRITFGLCGTPDDDASDGEEDHRDGERHDRLG